MKPHLENLQTGKEKNMTLIRVDPPKSKEIKLRPDAVFFNYTQKELERAFTKVKNKKDWKRSIRAIVNAEDFDVICAAVAYFTGSQLEIAENLGKKYRVHALGYYSAIGS